MIFGLLAATISLHAQTGTLTGRVTDSSSGTPLPGATVRINGTASVTLRTGAITGADGRYQLQGLPAGSYTVLITYLSYATFQKAITITPGQTITVDAGLAQTALGFGDVVVSASRRPEKITDAPASVSVVDARHIKEQPALTPVDHLKGIAGVDIVQSGMVQSNVVMRGFNNAFSGTLMAMTDNRIASVPSLRVNVLSFIPLVSEDIQQIEVIRGPGSALYGPNTANGVLHTITRSPFTSTGTWLSVTGGERDVFQGAVRHAGTIGDRIGYKISGQYMRGTDWVFADPVEDSLRKVFLADTTHRGVNPDTLKIGLREPGIERGGGEVRLDIIPFDEATAIFAVGMNQAVRNTEITGVGAAQARNWRYTYYQGRFLYKDLFLQAFLNKSDAGETYLLRSGEPIIDRSSLFVAQAQHAWEPVDIERLTYGVDMLLTNPVTDGTINGRNEEDDNISEFGAYLQSETEVVGKTLDLVVAGRIDKHSRLDDLIFSPRAALVYNLLENQTLRLTYNRAYSAPTTNEMFLDLIASHMNSGQPFNVRASGVPETGFSFNLGNSGPFMHSYKAFGVDSTLAIPISTAPQALWPAIQALVKPTLVAFGLKNGLDSIPSPPASVGITLGLLNPSTGKFEPVQQSAIANRSPVRPTINQTIELGYKGILFDRVSLSVDLYRSHYIDFVGPLQVITPNVFMQQAPLQAYLSQALEADFIAQGLPADSARPRAQTFAAVLAPRIAGIPLGTITPNETTGDPNAIYLTYRNYGDITLYGYDIGLEASVMTGLSLNGSLSYVDKNFFPNLDSVADLALNAPKFKFSLGAEYRDVALGLNMAARFRHVDGFPVNSGVYLGQVPGYSVVDLNLGYRLPWVEGLNLSVTAQNLLTFVEDGEDGAFDQLHSEFVGVAPIGRLVLARLQYEFQ
jgi:iron complex outermembrane receptor protein